MKSEQELHELATRVLGLPVQVERHPFRDLVVVAVTILDAETFTGVDLAGDDAAIEARLQHMRARIKTTIGGLYAPA